MTLSEFLAEVEGLSSQPEGTLRGNESLKSLQGWDSLAVVEFLSMADEKLGLQLEAAQLSACDSVNDLAVLCGLAP